MRQCLTYIFLLFQVAAISQATAKFYAQTDARKVVEGSYIELSFVLENIDGSDFTPPSFSDFQVISGPSRQTSISITNGRKQQSLSFGYTLRVKKQGNYNIGAATIKTRKGTLQTQNIAIEVVKGSERTINEEEEAFVIVEISDSVAYVGQQLVLDYKLYTVLDVRNAKFLVEPSYDGFYSQNLRQVRSGYQREIINGTEYYTKSIKRVALFPQQTGTYTIEEAPIELGVATKKQSRSFFFSTPLAPVRITCNPMTITVRNLPESNPYFSGAVGHYEMRASTPKRSLTTDEAIVVKMQIVGDGDSKTVLAPSWRPSDSLEIYDPNILEDEAVLAGALISHRKTFEYLLVPKYPGKYNLTARFSYYNPDSARMINLTQRLPRISVLKGSNKAPVIEQDRLPELQAIYTKTKLSEVSDRIVHGTWWHYLMYLLSALAMIGIYVYSVVLQKSGKRDPEYIKKNKAYSIAQERLVQAKQYLSQNDSKSFHQEIIVAFKKYLSDKKNIDALHLKREDILSQMDQMKISDSTKDDIVVIFDKCDMALYAPINAQGMQEVYDLTEKVISALEE